LDVKKDANAGIHKRRIEQNREGEKKRKKGQKVKEGKQKKVEMV